jgi:hypothetical protein
VIVSCPTCGTSYKRPPAPSSARARCGCCATTIDLSGLRPYRIVRDGEPAASDLARAGAHLPIGLDEPALATRIAASVGDAPPVWDESEPLPEIPEMSAAVPEFERPADETDEALRALTESTRTRSSALAVYGFWAAGGAIVGTGTSWTLGGTTLAGWTAGALCGLVAAWGWLQWTSRT